MGREGKGKDVFGNIFENKFIYHIHQCVCFIINIVGAMELVIIVKVVAKITKEVATIAEVADMEVDIMADMIISLDVG